MIRFVEVIKYSLEVLTGEHDVLMFLLVNGNVPTHKCGVNSGKL